LLIESEKTCFPYKHWTLKEINEQPETVMNSINKGGRIKNNSEVKLGGLEANIDLLKNIDNVIILGCGTSYFSGLYGMHFLKRICNFNTVQVFDGAELDISDIPKIGNTVFILITQSGETKDLHRCIEIAKNNNITTIGIVNVVDSLIARETDCGIYCNARREMSVASTKAFTSQVVCLSLMAIWFAQIHNVNGLKRAQMIKDLHNLPNDIQTTITNTLPKIKEYAKEFNNQNIKNMFLLGKGVDEFIAREGSLKIKEVSYIHSEAYAASALKHGPFALLDDQFPVILLSSTEDDPKIKNAYEEIRSRGSPIITITTKPYGEKNIVITKNHTYGGLLGIIPLQLFAYYLSISKGINPDIPKNLAKVVTVE
jgi:glucosamine--fructose-6-phosphate aminotransferase (isomerizing)